MVSWIKVTDIQCIIERAGELIKEVYDKRNFNVELKGDNTLNICYFYPTYHIN